MDSKSPELLSVEDNGKAKAASKRKVVKDSKKGYLIPEKLELTIKSLGYTENIINGEVTGYASLKFQCETKDKVSYEIYLSSLVKIRYEFDEETGKENKLVYPDEWTLNSKVANIITKIGDSATEGEVEAAINNVAATKKQFIGKTIIVGVMTYKMLNKKGEVQDTEINVYKFK
jgi:hypothetical protein